MRYPGGKNGAGVYQAIINQMPPHTAYFEPFLGGGAIFRLKRPALVNVGLDRDPAAVLSFLSSSGLLEASSGLASGSSQAASSAPAIVDPLFTVQAGDALEFLQRRRFRPSDLVYCDPPYIMATRRSGRIYRHEMTDRQHARLLRILRRLPCFVMVSGYWSAMYAEQLRTWRTFTFQAATRSGRMATEWVWSNFPEPIALHDYRYLGSTYRQRERIKRKTGRWVSRLGSMPLLERRALLDAIGQAWPRAGLVVSGDGRSTREHSQIEPV